MRRIRIDTTDRHRVLLSDVLPYETPLFFSNEGFYRFCRDHLLSAPPVIRTLLTGFSPGETEKVWNLNTVPYGYSIRKGTLGTRTLSLFHPAVQLQFVALYERFAHVVLHLCARSRFSLRRPAAIASAVFGASVDEADEDLQCGATYFRYEEYDLLYRFFESYEFQRLEKRYRHLRKFDIAKCFDHIYTHTLSWAVRSKEFAKKHNKYRSFDSDFDAIMQAANHKETAGILIGPEVSRIFAEIILQSVDAAVERRLAEKYKLGLDYDVRRYVDDFYVFSSTSVIGEEVMRTYHDELKHYRLDFNEAKSTAMVVPFMTPISCAKVTLGDVLDDFFDSVVEDMPIGVTHERREMRLRAFSNPGRRANRLIQRIKAVVMSQGVEFASISGFLLSVVERRLGAISLHASDDIADESLQRFLYALLDVTFFVYAMDVRVTTTYKVGRIALGACQAVADRSPDSVEIIKKKIFDESQRILASETRGRPELFVETVNLLAITRILGPDYRIPTETISRMMEFMNRQIPDNALKGVDYFLITSLLFHMADDSYYADLRSVLLQRILVLFEGVEDASKRTDFTCLFFDLLSCPFLTATYKTKVVDRMTIKGKLLSSEEKRGILAVVPSNQWFTDWQARDSIELQLEKKRYKSPY